MNKFYFWTLISLSVLNVFSEELAKKKVPLTKEQLEQKKANLVAIFPDYIENIFPDSDPVTNWDNNKFNYKQLKWESLMIPIYNFLEETGSTDFPKKFQSFIYDGKEQTAERIPNPWAEKSTISADIFNQSKKLNRLLEQYNFDVMTTKDIKEKRIKLIKEYLDNFESRCETISKNIKAVWVVNYGPKIAQEFFLFFVNSFLYKIREKIRGQYMRQEQKFIENVIGIKAQEEKTIEKEKEQAPLKKLKDDILAFERNVLSKIEFHKTDPNDYLSAWLNLVAKLSEFYEKNNANKFFNKINNLSNSLIQVSQKLFNSKTKPEIVHEAFDKDLKIINDSINSEILNINKTEIKENIRSASVSFLLLLSHILDKIKNNFTPFLTQFSKTIEPEIEKGKLEQEGENKQNYNHLRITLNKTGTPKFFQYLSMNLNKIIDKLNRLPEQYLMILTNYQDRKKINNNEQLKAEEKNNIFNLYTEIKKEIVALSKELSKQQFKEDTIETELKKKFLFLIGTPSDQFGYLGNQLDQILQKYGFKSAYEEIRRNI